MAATVEVLAGVAGSGKTARLLAEYRRALSQAQATSRPGSTLWLTPTNRARNAIVEQLCNGGMPILFGPNVLTFQDFAERLLRASPQVITPLSPAMQRLLLRQIVDRLLTEALRHFQPIAETAGFLDLVASFIAELKRGETWPDAFEEACAARGMRPADRELALIYREYQTTLLDSGVYDSEGRFWSAWQALRRGEWGPFGQLSLVVADGFTDFTHTQYEILGLLRQRAERLLISLPFETPLARGDLFAKPQAVLESLKKTGPVRIPESTGAPTTSAPDALVHIARTLFANPRETKPAASAEGVEIIAAAGERGEVRWLAGRIKTMLLNGARPEEIVIALRELADYRDLIEEEFSAAGIPFVCCAGTPLDRIPLCRALIQVLQLEVEDWPFDRLQAVLDSSFFQPDWPEMKQGRAVRDVGTILRQFKLGQGREQILKRLTTLAQSDPETIAAEMERVDRWAVERALRLLDRLSRATADLRKTHDLKEWAVTVRKLISDLGFARQFENGAASVAPPTLDADVAQLLERVLFDAARAELLTGKATVRRPLNRFLHDLTDLLQQDEAKNSIPEAGRVRILPAEQVRNLDVPYLFVSGLTERSFPRAQTDDCLYSESDRQELNSHGLNLAHRRVRAQEEMLMFYNVVTRARQRLVLTYPVVTADGEPLSPSPYLVALQDLFAEKALEPRLEERLSPIPAEELLLSVADARVRGMFDALDRRPGLLRAVSEQPDSVATVGNVLAAVDMHVLRFHSNGFSRYEGMLDNPDNLDWLGGRYSTEREFSATQLESYAACPFQFFLSGVLGIEPLSTVDVETEYGRRGNLVHDILATLHRELFANGTAGGEASPTPEGSTIVENFHNILRERLGAQPDQPALQQALLEIEGRLLTEWGSAYGEQWKSYIEAGSDDCDRSPIPTHFEMAFGRSGTASKAASPFGALVIGAGDAAVRIAGRIDRIDVTTSAGRTMFTVVDYKTGAQRSDKLEDITTGRALQLALYTLAVMRLGITGPDAGPLQMGYWHIRGQGFSPGIRQRKNAEGRIDRLSEEVWNSLVQALEEVIPHMAAALRGGKFPVFNADRYCTGRCPYHTVCRVAQIRALPEERGKVWSV